MSKTKHDWVLILIREGDATASCVPEMKRSGDPCRTWEIADFNDIPSAEDIVATLGGLDEP